MPTYGQRPQDVVTDSRGNTLGGVSIDLYASQALAVAAGVPLETVVTDSFGRWTYETEGELWARLSSGDVWEVAGEATGVVITDHGGLAGLDGDDHPQYALLADAIPLSTSLPLGGNEAGFAGTEAAASHGDHQHPLPLMRPTIRKESGSWATPQKVSDGGTALNIGQIEWLPFFLSQEGNAAITIDELAIYVRTAGSADASLILALYTNDPTTDLPGTKIADTEVTFAAGTLNSTGAKTAAISPYTFPSSPWFGWVGQVVLGTTVPVLDSVNRFDIIPQVIEAPGVVRGGPRLDGQVALPTTASFTAYSNDGSGATFIKLV